MEKTTPELRKDVNGKESSKRRLGITFLEHGLVMAWAVLLLSIAQALFLGTPIGEISMMPIWAVLGAGTSLLGVTVLEKYRG
jgi:hypothetical protein